MGRFQFSLRALLATIAAVSVTSAVITASPGWQTGLGLYLLALIYPAVFLTGAILAERNWRPFCIGALLPASVCLMLVFADVSAFLVKFHIDATDADYIQTLLWNMALRYRITLALNWAAMPLAGIACALADWLLFNSNRDKADRNGG